MIPNAKNIWIKFLRLILSKRGRLISITFFIILIGATAWANLAYFNEGGGDDKVSLVDFRPESKSVGGVANETAQKLV